MGWTSHLLAVQSPGLVNPANIAIEALAARERCLQGCGLSFQLGAVACGRAVNWGTTSNIIGFDPVKSSSKADIAFTSSNRGSVVLSCNRAIGWNHNLLQCRLVDNWEEAQLLVQLYKYLHVVQNGEWGLQALGSTNKASVSRMSVAVKSATTHHKSVAGLVGKRLWACSH